MEPPTSSALDLDVDLRPSPWRIHGWVLGLIGLAYLIFAVATWPTGDNLKATLGRIVVVLFGAGAVMLAALTTLMLAIFHRGRARLLKAYALAIAITAALIGLWLFSA